MRDQLARTGARRPVAVIGSFHAAALLPDHTSPTSIFLPDTAPATGPSPDSSSDPSTGTSCSSPRAEPATGLPEVSATGVPTTGRTTPSDGSASENPDPVTALIPYTFALLDSRSGYPAGIRDPEWQQDVYEAGADPERVERACARRLAAVGAHLRSHGHVSGLPDTAAAWFTVAWVLVLGTIACSLLGIAVSSLARTPQAASTIVVVPFLALQFTSGVFVPVAVLPDGVLAVASLFPLLWMAQGMRAAFYPDGMAAFEPSGAWDLHLVALALGAWCVVGLVLVLLTFRWRTRKDG
jgi:hypothetical protein